MHFIGHLFSQTQPNINSAQIPFLLLVCFGWKKVTLFYRQSIENSAPIWFFSLSQYMKYCIIKSMRYNNSRIIDLKAIQRLGESRACKIGKWQEENTTEESNIFK